MILGADITTSKSSTKGTFAERFCCSTVAGLKSRVVANGHALLGRFIYRKFRIVGSTPKAIFMHLQTGRLGTNGKGLKVKG